MNDTVDKAEAWDAVSAAHAKHQADCPDPRPNRADSVMEMIAENERLKDDRYVVWSHEHSAWWRPNSAGYCRDVREAGIYTRDEAIQISHTARDHWHPGERPDELPVRVADLPEFARAAIKDTPS